MKGKTTVKLADVLIQQPKSKIKAGDGKDTGRYKFFTSSATQSKFIDIYQYNQPALIFGTGGNPNVHFCNVPFATSTDCLVFFGESEQLLRTLYFYLTGNIEILEAGFRGVGLKHISKQYILNLSVALPDVKEQQKITSVLSKINALSTQHRRQLDLLDQLVKARFVEMFGDPVHNGKHLPTRKLGELGELDRGRSQHRPRNAPELLNGPYPLIQTGEIANEGLFITEYKNTYSELGLRQSKMWKAGTLCITIAANIAQTAILTFDACFPDSVVGFVPKSGVNAIYLHYWFSFFQKIMEEQAPQVAQKNINLKILSALEVIMPSCELQEQFASFVSKAEASKSSIQRSLAALDTLKKSLMQQYFN